MAEGRRIVLRRQVEMSQPQLLVGEGQQFPNRSAAALRYFHVEAAGEVQSANLLLPHKVKPIIAPPAGDLDDQLLLAGTVVHPVIGDDDLLDKVDRVTGIQRWFDNGHGCHQALLGPSTGRRLRRSRYVWLVATLRPARRSPHRGCRSTNNDAREI